MIRLTKRVRKRCVGLDPKLVMSSSRDLLSRNSPHSNSILMAKCSGSGSPLKVQLLKYSSKIHKERVTPINKPPKTLSNFYPNYHSIPFVIEFSRVCCSVFLNTAITTIIVVSAHPNNFYYREPHISGGPSHDYPACSP